MTDSKIRKHILLWLLPLIWMAVIFSFSAKPADQSDELSLSLGGMIGRMVAADFEQMPRSQQLAFAQKINYPIRKAAHAMEYAVLSSLLLFALGSYEIAAGKKYVLAFFVTAIYAASDEFHQLFVPGRSGQTTDVLIDCCGAALGLLLIWLLQKALPGSRK